MRGFCSFRVVALLAMGAASATARAAAQVAAGSEPSPSDAPAPATWPKAPAVAPEAPAQPAASDADPARELAPESVSEAAQPARAASDPELELAPEPEPMTPQPPLLAPSAPPPPASGAPPLAQALPRPPAPPPGPGQAGSASHPAAPNVADGGVGLLIEKPRTRAAAVPSLDVWAGVHALLVASRGYDFYSEDDVLPSFGAGLGWSLVGSDEEPHVAAVANVSVGGSEATVRGRRSELSVLRLGLGPELRLPVLDRVYVFGRLSPQAIRTASELAVSGDFERLERSAWSFGVDGALGAAWRLAEIRPAGLNRALGLFLRVEAGYAWSSAVEQRLEPSGSGAPVRSEPLDLGDLSLSGASLRGALGLGY